MKELTSDVVEKIGTAGNGYLINKVTIKLDTEVVDWYKVYTWNLSGIVASPPQFVAHADSLEAAREQVSIRKQAIENNRLKRIRSRNKELKRVREILANKV